MFYYYFVSHYHVLYVGTTFNEMPKFSHCRDQEFEDEFQMGKGVMLYDVLYEYCKMGSMNIVWWFI